MMYYCPHCGTPVKEDEQYCIKCGQSLPEDVESRMAKKKRWNRFWAVPAVTLLLSVTAVAGMEIYLSSKTSKAEELFDQAEKHLLKGDYEEAETFFSQAFEQHSSFKQAEVSREFAKIAADIDQNISAAEALQEERKYNEALSLLSESANKLKNYNGQTIDVLLQEIDMLNGRIKIDELKAKLEESPSPDELKILLWDAEAVNHDEALGIAQDIREQIVDHTFSKANEQLSQKQFSDAQLLIDDGLKYAPESEKLLSLQATVANEKITFESDQQQRIEQALDSAAHEEEVNETDAILLESASLKKDDQGNYTVSGKVKSVATIPINSVIVEYAILTKTGQEILTNEVVVFPDTLYPGENGDFEFTHFDLEGEPENYKIEVKKTTWYTG